MTPTTPVGGWAYGLLGWPLAFAALPLYVVLPDHYARELAVPLAPLGLTLLGVRLLDAWIDPWIGRQVDAWFAHPRRLRALAWGMAGGLALAFTGLFFPPMPWRGDPAWLLAWAATMLMLCSLAHGGLTVLHQAWGAGMALAVVGFVGAARLGAGDVAAFAVVCLVCGLAQGADLSVPPALLAGLLRRAGRAGQAEGLWFGWWQFTGKLSLALAAGTALPLLASLGYQPGQPDAPPANALGLTPLVLGYAVLPCVLKSLAGGLLWWLSRDPAFQPSEELPHD